MDDIIDSMDNMCDIRDYSCYGFYIERIKIGYTNHTMYAIMEINKKGAI